MNDSGSLNGIKKCLHPPHSEPHSGLAHLAPRGPGTDLQHITHQTPLHK